jgi:hypothetical protein
MIAERPFIEKKLVLMVAYSWLESEREISLVLWVGFDT